MSFSCNFKIFQYSILALFKHRYIGREVNENNIALSSLRINAYLVNMKPFRWPIQEVLWVPGSRACRSNLLFAFGFLSIVFA